MSLHLNQQCQRAQNTDAQLNLPFTGGAQRRQFDDHRDNHPVNRCGETPLRPTQPTVKQFLQFLTIQPQTHGNPTTFRDIPMAHMPTRLPPTESQHRESGRQFGSRVICDANAPQVAPVRLIISYDADPTDSPMLTYIAKRQISHRLAGACDLLTIRLQIGARGTHRRHKHDAYSMFMLLRWSVVVPAVTSIVTLAT
jgi:hypothetical protein